MKSKVLLFVFFLAFAPLVKAQVEFTAKASKTVMGVNGHLRVDFVINQNADGFVPPDFSDFRVIGGPISSFSRSYINGKGSFKLSYGFILQPKKEGKLTIGAAKIQYKDATYTTDPITITVTGAVVSDDAKGSNDLQEVVNKNVQIVTVVSNHSPYINEGIVVECRMYVSAYLGIENYKPTGIPNFPDFWSKNIPYNNKATEVKYKGEPYRYVVLYKNLLYPQKTGKIEIPPMEVAFIANIPTSQYDFFGNRRYKRIRHSVSSGKQTITVKPLPTDNRPESFTGAVGSFDLKVTADKTALKTSESLQIEIQVNGKGNLALFDLPKLKVPKALELYDPEHKETLHNKGTNMYGNILDTYTIVPKSGGKFPISPVEFSYFDPETESYKTLRSKEIILKVEGRVTSIPFSDSSAVGAIKQPVTSTKEFRYIKLDANLKPLQSTYFLNSLLFWALILLPVLCIPLFIFLGKTKQARANDLVGNRIKKADKLARKYLSEAKKNLGNHQAFYEALERALHNYLKAKFNLQTSEMSKEHIAKLLKERKATELAIAHFSEVLKSCEFARYTPSSEATMQQDYEKAAKTIAELDKQLK